MAKILLIEDDPLMVRMYQRKLINDNNEVKVAVNGEDGLVKIRSFQPDIVLLDIMMPKLNGLQVLERVKSDPAISDTPIIILTNLGGSQTDIERGLELGAVAYLVKSAYRPDEVIMKVKEVLRGYTHSKEIPKAASPEAGKRVLEKTTKIKSEEEIQKKK
ncbi:response regulator transcription factor [Patescibacteria group bacterium]